MLFDMILRGGRVIDPSQTLCATVDVGFLDGKVAAIGPRLDSEAGAVERDVSGLIVTPGLIDLHTHVYWGGTSLGIDAEAFGRASGVTTVVDTGSAGPGNFAGFRKHVIEKSQVRILALLNVSFAGIYGFGSQVGESEEIRLLSPVQSVEVVEANRDVIAGIKVRVGKYASGSSGLAPLDVALQVADETGLPLMAHIDFPPPSYEEVVTRLRHGDILTHCFRPFPNAPVNSQGAIRAAAREARERGVLFDIGHGQGSFSFKTARAMLTYGFQPDTISSDIHTDCIDGPVFDQTTTLSKFLCLGMSLNEVISASTINAASALRRPELGSLKPGSAGDASILALEEGSFDYVDCRNEVMRGNQRLVARGVVLNGRWWDPLKATITRQRPKGAST
ncbi:amidohydrolase/deacetylase family metallohydrolase [Mesorhizobium sp. M0968]|uniref:amidohydrolase/deacetylase family metallohydrolase n=1 Tax=Mesorhizobium sp. M0968 TaxID=2957037 RepID=UPI0033393986